MIAEIARAALAAVFFTGTFAKALDLGASRQSIGQPLVPP